MIFQGKNIVRIALPLRWVAVDTIKNLNLNSQLAYGSEHSSTNGHKPDAHKPDHLVGWIWQTKGGFIPMWNRSNRHIDGLMQDRRNSIANALELRLSCTNPLTMG